MDCFNSPRDLRPATGERPGFFGIFRRTEHGIEAPLAWVPDRIAGSPERTDGDTLAFAGTGALTNRREIRTAWGPNGRDADDAALLQWAFRRWGVDCASRLKGDWAFAAWEPPRRTLTLARDAFGATAVYYYLDRSVFAFSSSRNALLRLRLAPAEIDELYLAQLLVSWPAYHGARSIYRSIGRLPPAHSLTVGPAGADLQRYWQLENSPELSLPSRRDYISGFREVFERAVTDRIEAAGPVGAMLSGGLDSGAVAVTAAERLRLSSRRLLAFTSVPVPGHSTPVNGNRLGNEWAFARTTADAAGNVDLFPITLGLTPVQGLRRMLGVTGEPIHSASNAYWMLDILDAAAAKGCGVVLTGQCGNATISWAGSVTSQSWRFQIERLGWHAWARATLRRWVPSPWLVAWRRRKLSGTPWHRHSAIHPEFATRLRLLERRLEDPMERGSLDARAARCYLLQPGRQGAGALVAALAETTGVRLVDPTADERILEFTFSIPDHVFIDPQSGQDRWLIREAMKTRLPAVVRLNKRYGWQAADLLARLRASAPEVDQALDDLDRGPAAAYVDVPYMRNTWQAAQYEDTPQTLHRAGSILMRGIMAGLFVNEVAA